MTRTTVAQGDRGGQRAPLNRRGTLQRKCACGNRATGGTCGSCNRAQQSGLRIGEPGDVFEREADRVAAQVVTATPRDPVIAAKPGIRRFSQPAGG
ncbi:MAG: hypothetical protein AAFX58_03765, partial [Pseudomonadota bacterium]